MEEPMVPVPEAQWIDDTGFDASLPSASEIGMADDPVNWMPEPGTAAAREVLRSFLYERGRRYRTDMSSPTLGATGGSRLSPHIRGRR